MSAYSKGSRFRFAAAAFASSALVLGSPASAQAPGSGLGSGVDIDIVTLTKAKVGAYADYAMSVPGQSGEAPKVRYAVVEHTGGKLVLEIDTATPKGEVDMRLDFAPEGAEAWRLVGGKMKLPGQAVDFPAAEIAAAPPLKKGDAPGELVGTETLTTPAGTFACKHYKKNVAFNAPGTPAGQKPQTVTIELWMSDKVSPTGLVKSSVGPMSMLLAGTGQGAQAKVK